MNYINDIDKLKDGLIDSLKKEISKLKSDIIHDAKVHERFDEEYINYINIFKNKNKALKKENDSLKEEVKSLKYDLKYSYLDNDDLQIDIKLLKNEIDQLNLLINEIDQLNKRVL